MSTDLLRNPLVNEGRTLIDDLLGILFPFFRAICPDALFGC
jgi:hypothetical protein